ncbi:MAG: hypothetical protein OEY49_19690 [Candidatus Heimdallarchaeota archaeon]|nr:hypothetical protein [Candidatus Heimdallarchaeota archaeon]
MKHNSLLLTSFAVIGLIVVSGAQIGVIANSHLVLQSEDNITVETNNIVMSVTGGGNVPFYTFWKLGNNDSVYRVQFTQIFEVNDNNDNGIYDINGDTRVAGIPYSLSSLTWEFSEIVSDDNGNHFNITSSNGIFTFANHIGEDANSLKFDVIINSTFQFNSSDSLLVLAFSLKQLNRQGNENINETGNSIGFDDAFFEIEDTAEDDNGVINVGLSYASESGLGGQAYISYEQFSGQLIHDPTIGILTPSIENQTNNADEILGVFWSPEISIGLLSLTTLFASSISIFVLMALYKKRE